MKVKFDVFGMTCSACSINIEKNVGKMQGIENVNVNLLQNYMTVQFDEKIINVDSIIAQVKARGYDASVKKGTGADGKGDKKLKNSDLRPEKDKEMKKQLVISIVFLIPLMYFSMGQMVGMVPKGILTYDHVITLTMTQLLLLLPIMYVNRKYYEIGISALIKKSANMDSLIAIGTIASFAYGIFAIYRMGYGLAVGDRELVISYNTNLYFDSAGMILTLITGGKYLEAKAKGKTFDAIGHLIDLSPKTGIVELNGIEQEIPADELEKNQVVILKQGHVIPSDGVICNGSITVDESSITGESLPVEKTMESEVIGATMVVSGFAKARVTRIGEETTFSQIIKLVEEASGSKAPIARMVDKVASVFVPVVISISVITGIIWLMLGYGVEFALSNAITVLVISCPCALGLATPTAIMVGTGRAAQSGILIKSAEILEATHMVDTVVLDKTGTITEGKPQVTDFILRPDIDEKYLLGVIFALEKMSEHPLSKAIISYAEERKVDKLEATDFFSAVGQGIGGMVGGKYYFCGNSRMMQKNNVSIEKSSFDYENISEEGKTMLFIASEGGLLGIIGIADKIKETSKHAISEMGKMGIEVIMMTGDNEKTANHVGEQVGIKRIISQVLPQDKEAEVRKLRTQNRFVAMVGDGINDAPALSRADVGIAIGAGTDIAIESADIVLVRNSLADCVSAIKLSAIVIRNIKQNLFWALFYNVLGIPIAAGVLYPIFEIRLSPMIGAAAMSLSSLFVVINALRLRIIDIDKVKVKNQSREGKESKNMVKKIYIEGMMCEHCKGRVEKSLESLEGAKVTVDLAEKTATIEMNQEISNEKLIESIEKEGYKVIKIMNQ